MENIDPNDMLLVQARRCRRCGRVLTGRNAIQDGIGRACKLLEKQEQESRRWEEENQYSLFTPRRIRAARRVLEHPAGQGR